MALKQINYDVRLLSTEKTLQGKAPIVYTNDLNSAEFVFNILDMTPEQLVGATAKTMLYMRDGSFFQNSDVNLNGNTFTYLLKENEGNHAGLAQIQLVVIVPGTPEQNYPTRLYNFEVVTGLETKVASEVMIQDWTTLTREAQTYIDGLEMKDAEMATIVANAKAQVEANILETAVAEKYAGLETQYATDLSTLKQSDDTLAARLQQAVGAVTADSEVVLARGGETTLGQRLDKMDDRIDNNFEDAKLIFGVHWDKSANPTLTRTDDAVGLVANVGKGGELVQNDFDTTSIYREIGDVIDEYGNEFVSIPKFYIQKSEGPDYYQLRISKTKYPGFYLPKVFWDFENSKELDYYLHGKYKANISVDGTKLESRVGEYPLVNRNIVQFRALAQANNTLEAKGYQQLDIHAQDVLSVLFTVEFATLNSQSVMQGYTTGRYTNSDLATVAETETNRFILPSATADQYRVGQTVSLGTSQGGNQITYGRTITAIEVYDESNKAIVFDGAPVDIAVGNFIYNSGWKNGFSKAIAASSGYIVANDGKYPCSYRGIESPWGDLWQLVDGINISDNQSWVAENATDYVSNKFESPYQKMAYVNSLSNGWVSRLGFDAKYPYANMATEISAGSTTYYADYHYQATGQRVAHVGGSWAAGSNAGLWCWYLNNSSGTAAVNVGGRLLKKAL